MSEENIEVLDEKEQEETQLTPEEYKEARKKAMEHLKNEIEYVKTEKQYENLVADVEEAKTRGITAIATRAQFFARQNVAAQPDIEGEVPTQAPPKASKPAPPRPLKKD